MNQIKITEEQKKCFKKIADRFAAKATKQGNWKSWKSNDVWLKLLGQVMIVGTSEAEKRFKCNKDLVDKMSYNRLITLTKQGQRKDIHFVLREVKSRYCSQDIKKCKKTNALVHNLNYLKEVYNQNPEKMMQYLAKKSAADRVKHIKNSFKYLGNKGARDFLMTAGLATNTIAFDSNILKIFKKIGVGLPQNVYEKLTISSSKLYDQIEGVVIREVCKPLNLTGKQFDRLLYNNSKDILKMTF